MEKHVSVVVQNKPELFTLGGIMNSIGCESYLEIGASCGGSALMLAPLVSEKIVLVDLFEDKSAGMLKAAMNMIADLYTAEVIGIKGDSRHPDTVEECAKRGPYDVVMIDGGHQYETVKSDYEKYGPLAKKLVVFHDINQPGVKRLWEEIGSGLSVSEHGSTMGYGVLFK
jgi:predicted O-methyltransferase YrrM